MRNNISLFIISIALFFSCGPKGSDQSADNWGSKDLYIVESKGGEVTLRPHMGLLSFIRVSAGIYDISVVYQFDSHLSSKDLFTLKIKDVVFMEETGVLKTDSKGLQASCELNGETFAFLDVEVNGSLGRNEQTAISFRGLINGESFALDIDSVLSSEVEAPSYEPLWAEIDYTTIQELTFENNSGMDCILFFLGISGNEVAESAEIRSGSRYMMKTSTDGGFWESECYALKIVYSNGDEVTYEGTSVEYSMHNSGMSAYKTEQLVVPYLFVNSEGRIIKRSYSREKYSIVSPYML